MTGIRREGLTRFAAALIIMVGGASLAHAQLVVSPSPIHFGNVGLALRSTQAFTITNKGTTSQTINSFTFSPSNFGLADGRAPVTVAPGQVLNYSMAFKPVVAEVYSGTFTINIQGGTTVVTTVSGTGESTTADPVLTTTALNFGNVAVGRTISQNVTVTNNGTSSINITEINYYSPFNVTGCGGTVTLSAGQSCTFTVSYSPFNLGTVNEAISVDYNLLPSAGISLTGTGITPSALAITNFPIMPDATPGDPYTFTLLGIGGTAPYTWQITAGGIKGLSLKASTGVISGTLASTTAPGNYTVTATVKDSSSPQKKATATLTLPVAATTGANCANDTIYVTGTTTPNVALNDLGTGSYLGYEGGLYSNGSNTDPSSHEASGVAIAQNIQPLDADGTPDPTNGIEVLISLGISNTQQPFIEFIDLATADPDKNPKVVVVNGALGGATAYALSQTNSSYMNTVINYLLPFAGVTPKQVVAAWVNAVDSSSYAFPTDATTLQSELETLAQELHTDFPNLQLAYFGSLNYSGYSNGVSTVDPEPQGYESAFGDKWAIADQINGKSSLNFDPTKGTVKAPWMAWGDYYWTNGLIARQDGTYWACQDLGSDGLHPTYPPGHLKIAEGLLDFFKSDPTATPWFLAPGER